MQKENNKSAQGQRKARPQNNKNNQGGSGRPMRGPHQRKTDASKRATRQAQNDSRRNAEDADREIENFLGDGKNKKPRATMLSKDSQAVRIIGLGGMDGTGSKNMIVIETAKDAIVVDCGQDLSIDLPGINMGIPDVSYLEKIKHKLRAYVITHGHLDHIGGMPFIVPNLPAPVYGSRFTIGMVESIFDGTDAEIDPKFELKNVVMNQDNHERIKIGDFVVELVRVTHAIPGSTMVVIDTPAGRIINSGDFKLDPDPLDHMPSDIARLKELGKEGVQLLLSESTSTERVGRTPTEQVIEPSFQEIVKGAPGRVFFGSFSSNINRIQMIVNASVADGYKIAFDGRSLLKNLEIAVRLGNIKIPKGTVISMAEAANIKDGKVVIVCTGSQGEDNAALNRMGRGEHKFIKMKPQDTVIFSSTPIPGTGNDQAVERLVDNLMRSGVHVFQQITKDMQNIGDLHVSGHASREEYWELVEYTQPKYFMPIYGCFSKKQFYIDLVAENGFARENTYNAELGEVIELTKSSMKPVGEVNSGTVLVDNTGSIISSVVIKDRLLMTENGIMTVILTVNAKSGQVMTSPDVISRGFVYLKENEELLGDVRKEAKFFTMRKFKKMKLDDFKNELRGQIQAIVYRHTRRSPVVITVVNVVGGQGGQGSQRGRSGQQGKGHGPAVKTVNSSVSLTPEEAKRIQEEIKKGSNRPIQDFEN